MPSDDEDRGYDYPMSKLDSVDGHYYVVTHDWLGPQGEHALDCQTCIEESVAVEAAHWERIGRAPGDWGM